jgi:Fe-S-cluster-containing dehydrogenase component
MDNKNITDRRNFLSKLGTAVVAGAALSPIVSKASELLSNNVEESKKKWAMIIDLQKCTGCGACTVACKNENNVPDGIFWANKISKTEGKFPNVRFDYMPTLCNHCNKAPCVKVCPTSAMHKSEGGITMHDPKKCIGCRYCMTACPYNVISFNDRKAHSKWRSEKAVIEDSTASPSELNEKVGGNVIPYYNPEREDYGYAGIRPMGVVEKCTFCDHLVNKGEDPRCVQSCPSKARIFGDINDPDSNVNYLLGKYKPFRLKEELGTEPKVHYIRSFNPGSYPDEI